MPRSLHFMRITTPTEVAKQAGNKYLGVLVAAKFARYLNEFPKDQLAHQGEKLTTKALQSLTEGELNYKLVRRRRSEA
jgi:DNA-directed RNA polymerase subunit K/omega